MKHFECAAASCDDHSAVVAIVTLALWSRDTEREHCENTICQHLAQFETSTSMEVLPGSLTSTCANVLVLGISLAQRDAPCESSITQTTFSPLT